jgi:hypothetical protein
MSSVGEQGRPPTTLGEAEPAVAMEKLWEEHMASEFKAKSAEAAINTMVERPPVNHVPS